MPRKYTARRAVGDTPQAVADQVHEQFVAVANAINIPLMHDWGALASAQTIDAKIAEMHVAKLSANIAVTLSTAKVPDRTCVRLFLTQDATGSRTVTSWTGVTWLNGITPTLRTTAAAYDLFEFTFVTSLTTWVGRCLTGYTILGVEAVIGDASASHAVIVNGKGGGAGYAGVLFYSGGVAKWYTGRGVADNSDDYQIYDVDTGATVLRIVDATGLCELATGLHLNGPASLSAAMVGYFSYESGIPGVREYIGDGTGYTRLWSKRGSSVTTDLMKLSDTTDALTLHRPSGGIGYGTGAGGTATQATSRTTAVLLNTICGQITLFNGSLAAGAFADFVVFNTVVAATDVVLVNILPGGTGSPVAFVVNVAVGAFTVRVFNQHASTADTSIDKLNFAVIRAVTS